MIVKDTSSFIAKSKIVHGDKYDYSKSIYTKSTEKISINCRSHGLFEQKPRLHVSGKGCPSCPMNSKKDTSYFIDKSKSVHGDLYDYSKSIYTNRNENIEIICKKHGSFWQAPHNHYAGKGCSLCKNEDTGKRCLKTFDQFAKDAKSVHGEKYKYIESTYKNAKEKMDMVCATHGIFRQSPNKHLMGQGCRKCFYARNDHLWSYSAYKNKCAQVNNGKSKIYLIKCSSDKESFFKIGVSVHGALSRFDRLSKMPYSFEMISEIELDAISAMKEESRIHRILRENRHDPLMRFNGHTECFSELTQEVKDFFGIKND